MAPEIHIPETLLPTQAVPAAREGRIKRCAGPNHLLTTPPPNNPIRSEKGSEAGFNPALTRQVSLSYYDKLILQSLLIPSRYETVIQLSIG